MCVSVKIRGHRTWLLVFAFSASLISGHQLSKHTRAHTHTHTHTHFKSQSLAADCGLQMLSRRPLRSEGSGGSCPHCWPHLYNLHTKALGSPPIFRAFGKSKLLGGNLPCAQWHMNPVTKDGNRKPTGIRQVRSSEPAIVCNTRLLNGWPKNKSKLYIYHYHGLPKKLKVHELRKREYVCVYIHVYTYYDHPPPPPGATEEGSTLCKYMCISLEGTMVR